MNKRHSLDNPVDIGGVEYVPLCCAKDAVAAAREAGHNDVQEHIGNPVSFAMGVKAARDAVDAIPTSAFDVGIVGKDDALAAIDGVTPDA